MGALCVAAALLFAMSAKEDLMCNVWYLYASLHFVLFRLLILFICMFIMAFNQFWLKQSHNLDRNLSMIWLMEDLSCCAVDGESSIVFLLFFFCCHLVLLFYFLIHVNFTLFTNFAFFFLCCADQNVKSLHSLVNEMRNGITNLFFGQTFFLEMKMVTNHLFQ